MKLIKTLFIFLFLTAIFTSYAHENKHIFVGKTGQGDDEKVSFILNLLDDEVEKYIHVSEETGEIFLKVDNIVSVPKAALAQTGFNAESDLPPVMELIGSRNNEPDVRCSNCKRYYDPRYYHGRRCPNCGTSN